MLESMLGFIKEHCPGDWQAGLIVIITFTWLAWSWRTPRNQINHKH